MEELPGWAQAIGVLAGVGAMALLTLWTIIAFVGGTLWPTGIEVEGGVGFGIVWVVVIDPLAATVLYWAFVLLMLPVVGAAKATRRRR